MLGEVMNRAPEGRAGASGLRPVLVGEIRFDDVVFRYPGAQNLALDRASFTIHPGTVVGIVGRSGSGKTTLTKLIQGLYPVVEGIVRFDGIDAREIELSHLRRQIGVVLQENFLFRGTVRENLTVTKPDATFEEILEAAAAAGADEFIERLPMGYDTMLEENASNLSGGQKQRLSIARSLLGQAAHPDPRRGGQRARPRERGHLHQEPVAHRRRPHRRHDLAPPVDAGQRQHHPRHAAGPPDGRRHPCRTAHP